MPTILYSRYRPVISWVGPEPGDAGHVDNVSFTRHQVGQHQLDNIKEKDLKYNSDGLKWEKVRKRKKKSREEKISDQY